MKALIFGLLLLTTGLAGCSDDDNNDNPAPENQEQSTAEERRIAAIKAEVRRISSQAVGRFDSEDNDPLIAAQLEPFITELETLNDDERTLEETQAMIIGSWQQIWSNVPVGEAGKGALADYVYQSISPGDNLWNMALVENGPIRRTELLRAHYQLTEEFFDFTYTKAVFISQWLPQGTDLNVLTEQANRGIFDVNMIVYEEGKNPLGIKASLRPVFIDDNFRVYRYTDALTLQSYLVIFERNSVITASP